MISRRNIRVKVMQTLYTLTTLEPGEQEKNKNSPDAAQVNETPLKILAKPRAN